MTRFLTATILFLAMLGVMLTGGIRMPAPPPWYVERLRLAPDAGSAASTKER